MLSHSPYGKGAIAGMNIPGKVTALAFGLLCDYQAKARLKFIGKQQINYRRFKFNVHKGDISWRGQNSLVPVNCVTRTRHTAREVAFPQMEFAFFHTAEDLVFTSVWGVRAVQRPLPARNVLLTVIAPASRIVCSINIALRHLSSRSRPFSPHSHPLSRVLPSLAF